MQNKWGEESPLDQKENILLDQEEEATFQQLHALMDMEADVTEWMDHCATRMVQLCEVVGLKNVQFNPNHDSIAPNAN